MADTINNTYELLKSCLISSGGTNYLNSLNNTYEVLSAVYDSTNDALRVRISGLSGSSSILWEEYNSTTIQPKNLKNVYINGEFEVEEYVHYNPNLFNTYLGHSSALNNTTGYQNTALGDKSMSSVTTGYQNVAIGNRALSGLTTGKNNVAIGEGAAQSLKTGNSNTSIGRKSGENLISGSQNNFIGKESGRYTTIGKWNNVQGNQALKYNIIGNSNVAIGNNAMQHPTGSTENVTIGAFAMGGVYGADNFYNNVIIGAYAGGYLTYNISGSTLIGHSVGKAAASSNVLMIDNKDTQYPLIYGEFDNRNAIIGGSGNAFATGVTNSVIIGGNNQALSNSNTLMTPKIELSEDGEGIIMRTPDGTKQYKITIDNTGNLITTLV